jgi:hypothetical protein
VTDKGLNQLTKLTDLRELNVTDCKGISYPGVEKFRQALPKCKVNFGWGD